MLTYQRSLNFTVVSIQGACFHASRQVYMAVVRAVIAYSTPVWHSLSKVIDKPQGIVRKLARVQNKALQKVSRAYRATPIPRLEIETLVPLLNHYLDRLTVNYLSRTKGLAVSREIQEAYATIASCLRHRRRERPRGPADPTPRQVLEPWADWQIIEGEALLLVGTPNRSTERKKKLKRNAVTLQRKQDAYIKTLPN